MSPLSRRAPSLRTTARHLPNRATLDSPIWQLKAEQVQLREELEMWKKRALAKEEDAVSAVSARRLSSIATNGLGLLPGGVSQNGCEAGGSPTGSRAGVGLSTGVSQAGASMLNVTVTHDC